MEEKRKKLILLVLTLMIIAVAGIVVYYWYEGTHYVSTEDAKVSGEIVKIAPQISGKIVGLNIEEGQNVVKDQILGRLELLNQPDSSIDTSLIRAPISGTIIKCQGNVGEMATSGQTLGMMADYSKLYVTANIEETKLSLIKEGQPVDISIDQLADQKFTGKVKYIGKAAVSTFSLLPASSSGNFTKVIQKIAVKIELDKHDVPLSPNTNAVVKIHIK